MVDKVHYETMLSEMQRDLARLDEERAGILAAIAYAKAKINGLGNVSMPVMAVSGTAQARRKNKRKLTLAEASEEFLISENRPMTTREIYEHLRSNGIGVKNPNSLHAVLHKSKKFERMGDKWNLLTWTHVA